MASSHGRFVWYELMTTDVEAAKAFYGKVVGWGAREAPGSRYTLFTAGRAATSGLVDLPLDAKKRGARPQWVGYISVDDVDGSVNRVKELGGTIHIPPTDAGDVSRFSVVSDPQMATFILVKWSDPGRQPPIDPRALGHVGWHELLAVDWKRAFAFYREIFGWQKVGADTDPTGIYQQFSVAGQAIGACSTSRRPRQSPFGFTTLTSPMSVRRRSACERSAVRFLKGRRTYQVAAELPAARTHKAPCSH